jgi:hypothetical protein
LYVEFSFLHFWRGILLWSVVGKLGDVHSALSESSMDSTSSTLASRMMVLGM